MHGNSQSSFITRHLVLLVIAAFVIGIVYIEIRTINAIGTTAILLIFAHIAAVLVIIYGFSRTKRHSHSHDELETDGVTIGWAAFYDVFIRLLFSGNVNKLMKSTVQLANLRAGDVVLDVGCGTGTAAILAKQTANVEIHGIDASPQMIERARQKAEKAKVTVNFQTGLAEAIQFPNETFDVVMSSLMMHHLPDHLRPKALAEMYRILKPGGRVLIVDFEPPKKGLYKSFLTLFLGEMTSIDNTRIPPLVQDAGFMDVKKGSTATAIGTYISGIKPG